ncbi:MAG: NifB/NifX family molybdenum-iron cluster-binding protein [Lachnospiraceae bacterium]|nr:NifB/NifX family molybdenum-iron cluster-binding protein [Lachnospiraceae bacterium]
MAIAYGGDGTVPVFEKTAYFEFYTVLDGRKRQKNMLSIPDNSTKEITKTLKKMRTDFVICRNIGPRALNELRKAGIKCILFEGGPNATFKEFLNGSLEPLK